ncbi:sensor histidine kinase YesM [Chitinophaga skermanii]|uniref:Sensor histidine kinase YesM n=1 Tax=Chitinophaga skermanii TaxID=331697 RepID=A0A327QCG0_9BACT|nr:histidine kinase [Chitinophaga skermanii]RAJ02336.1 sensor histidine kinase YesM [Chitinophaga skermanii]
MHRIILFLIYIFTLTACNTRHVAIFEDPKFNTGDNMPWASKEYVDSNWRSIRGNTGSQIFWLRAHCKLTEPGEIEEQLGINVYGFGSFEIYWDGALIGKNGQVQTSTQPEIPGTESSSYLIPMELATQGPHLIAMRITQANSNDYDREIKFKISPYKELIASPLNWLSIMNMTAGVFLVAAIYFLFLFINSSSKDKALLIFCIICFLFFALQVSEYIKFYITIPYSYFYTRLEIIGIITFIISLLIPLYLAIQFQIKWKWPMMSILSLTLLAIYMDNYGHYDMTAWYLSLAMWIVALIIVSYAVYKKENGAVIVLIGLLSRLLINYVLYYDASLFISFNVVILCMLYLQTIKLREAEQAHQQNIATSNRLKNSLLKKNIQPHFIKNTLTSLIDWIEESPKEGAIFVQALSSEFDILNQISDETLVPIQQEIALCEAHLKVMHFRKEIHYQWSTSGIDPSTNIPPAIIHTLLENGITHSMPLEDGNIRFHLAYEQHPGWHQFTLSTFAKNRPTTGDRKESTGFQYVKSRLTESYQQHWTFHSAATTTGWENIIKIYHHT